MYSNVDCSVNTIYDTHWAISVENNLLKLLY